jgi:hypothetical protein
VAGIIFSVLFTTSMVLIRLALPEDLRGTNIAAWLQGNTTTISLALTFVPFAGIAFLWFVGVVRSRLGSMEDQFFSTVFFGSGLLFICSHVQYPTYGDVDYEDHDGARFTSHPTVAWCGCRGDCGIWLEVLK